MIRVAQLEDAKEVFHLVQQLESDTFTLEEFMGAYLHNLQYHEVYVYEVDHQVVGLASLVIYYPLHHGGKMAEIGELIDDKKMRGQGIGKKLLNKLILLAMKEKCKGIELASNQKRVDAHRFYQREGFINTHYKLTMKLPSE